MKIFRLEDRLLFWNLGRMQLSIIMYCLENRGLLYCVHLGRMRAAGPVNVTISMMV